MAFIGLKKVEQGKALIRTRVGSERVDVSFTGMWVWPFVHKIEEMDISVKTIEIDRRGQDGLICKDNIRADIKVTFFVRVNKTKEDVIKVAQAIGCTRASDHKTLEALFAAKFSEALKTVGKQLDFVDLYTKRDEFRDQIIQVIGTDLNGYSLEDAAIDYLEQTPLDQLDRNNILDAQGIRKITQLTAIEHISTNEYRRDEEKKIKKQDVEAAETIYELERQQADAEAKQKREIETVRAREQAETLKVQAEEKRKAELARIKADEEIGIQEENRQREIAVAQKNRERVVAVESERVEKDRMIEVIARERETELQRIAKDKEVEQEKREIANVIRERVAVDKTVAEQEEAIKRLRVVEEAERTKEATVITAAAEAEERLIKDIKAAEAAEKAAQHKGKEMLVLAEAELAASDKRAAAKIRLAEGVQAETAAPGLAEVQVKEADAAAIERVGMAEARVKEADAAATEKMGLAEAAVLREKGIAEGTAIQERLKGEAIGLTEKAHAMKTLDEASREHEEFRLRLEKEKDVELAGITTQRQIAEAQAMLVAEGLKQAKIDIVGGESVFFDRLVNAMSAGKAVDGFVNKSAATRTVLRDYLSGEASLAKDLKEVLSHPALDSDDVKNLTVAGLLGKLIGGGNEATKEKLGKLLAAVNELGLGDVKVAPRE
ncbi:MAG: flotillin family protein [Acidobacteria bacterium]|nr:MAG: flotillin family protein [Acidobacteriota bacterium]